MKVLMFDAADVGYAAHRKCLLRCGHDDLFALQGLTGLILSLVVVTQRGYRVL